jgi:hypothetical protein
VAYLLTPRPLPFSFIFVPCDAKMPDNLPPLLIDEAWQFERVMFLIPMPEVAVPKVGSC